MSGSLYYLHFSKKIGIVQVYQVTLKLFGVAWVRCADLCVMLKAAFELKSAEIGGCRSNGLNK